MNLRHQKKTHALGLVLLICAPGCGDTDGSPSPETGSGGDANHSDDSGGSESGGAGASGGSSSGGVASGGSDTGGTSSGGLGGQNGGTGGGDACGVQTAGPYFPGAARSAGFSGTDAEYAELYDHLCDVPGHCLTPCMAGGGTEAFCAETKCVEGSASFCLPPTKWRALVHVLTEGKRLADAAVTSLSLANGDEHDLLIVDDFGFNLPADAEVVGISASIRKASESADEASDQAVRLVRAGVVGETDRGTDELWPVPLTSVVHGSMSDLWGESWSASDINSEDFGLAMSALPITGSGRAYVDTIAITVYFQQPCN